MKLSARFEFALAFAARLHSAQVRKGTDTPYVAHLLAVAAIVLEHGGTEDEAVAALLHDAIEDQGGDPTRQTIRRLFGDGVAEIVDGCTDADTLPKPPWRERKESYVAHVRHAEPSVRLVSAADKLHNARSILADLRTCGDELWSRFKGGREGTLWYYRALVEAYSATGRTPLVEELDRTVTEIERIASDRN
jgi:GTP pyrophosphokinase